MARRTVFWHIGPDDLGTGFLAQALDVRRPELAEQGVLVAGTPREWELATVELLGTHHDLGYKRAEVEGQTSELVREMWAHKGVSVISTPGLAAAPKDQVLLALDGIRGADIHLVLVVRDEAAQAYAGAQAALEGGATTKPEKYVRRVLEADSEHPQAAAYRAGHDVADILRRWSRTVLEENVHVISESEPELVWKRFTDLLGAHVTWPEEVGPSQLAPAQLGVLREVALSLDDQLDARARRTALRDRLSRTLLPAPEDVTAEQSLTSALADALVEVARLQQAIADLAAENARLDKKRRKHKRRLKALTNGDGSAA